MTDLAQLIVAIKDGAAETVSTILTHRPDLAPQRDDDGISLILLALYHQQQDIASKLRANVDTIDGFEASALGEVEILRDMFGPAPDFTSVYSPDGFLPLHLAAFFRQPAAARFLLAHGADPDAITKNASKLRPIHSACAANHAGLVRILLAAGADPDCQQHGGHTALHASALHGNEVIIRVLLANGANATLHNDDNQLPADMLPDEHKRLKRLFVT